MKITIIAFVISFNLFAYDYSRDYVEMPDGTERYIGSCTLHEDYQDEYYSVELIIPYEYYPNVEFYQGLTDLQKLLFAKTYELVMYEDFSIEQLGKWSMDDFSIEKIIYPGSDADLIRVNYGVGGGNGGYLTFAFTPYADKFLTLLSHSFDGELLECDDAFKK